MAQCMAMTRNGQPCNSPALRGSDICHAHAGGIGGRVEGAGRKRALEPQPDTDLRAGAERMRPAVLRVLENALYAEYPGGGGAPRPDWDARLKAAELVLTLGRGRP
jgi:hypothetical protein